MKKVIFLRYSTYVLITIRVKKDVGGANFCDFFSIERRKIFKGYLEKLGFWFEVSELARLREIGRKYNYSM